MMIPIPTTPPFENMAMVILNDWRDSLLPGVATYAKLIDED